MAKKTYNCYQISLVHSRMVELQKSGKLDLGIDDDLSARLASVKGLGSTKRSASIALTSTSIAFHFFSWLALGGFFYSIYLSFTSSWWWFLIGIMVLPPIWGAIKKGNSENYLDAAMIDEEFYERVRNIKGWHYRLEEDTIKQVLHTKEQLFEE